MPFGKDKIQLTEEFQVLLDFIVIGCYQSCQSLEDAEFILLGSGAATSSFASLTRGSAPKNHCPLLTGRGQDHEIGCDTPVYKSM